MRLQYLAGFEINRTVSDPVYEDLRAYRRFPDNLFRGIGPVYPATEGSVLNDPPPARRPVLIEFSPTRWNH